MAFLQGQTTILATATQLSAADLISAGTFKGARDRTPIKQIVIQADDGNSNEVYVGGSGVTTANGYKINDATANVPDTFSMGPFSGESPMLLEEFYVIGGGGQGGEIVNWFIVTH